MNELKTLEKTLQNGMRVVLIHKPDFMKSIFMCSTQAGGFDKKQMMNNEIIEHPSGCAHFLEHQMFRYEGQDVSEWFAKYQAQTNAYTSYKETTYYFQTSADVKPSLRLLLDFVQNLDIDTDSVEKEKGIILSEYDMTMQNPEQQLVLQTYKSLYHIHPLRQDILGTKEDISAMQVEQLSKFYQWNYDPSRLIVIGVTGKDVQEIMNLIETHELQYEHQVHGKVECVFENEPIEVERPYFEKEMDVSFPYVCVSYKMKPYENSLEAYRADQSMELLLEAHFSSLNPDYQRWIDERIITQSCGAECDFTKDHAYVLFYAQTQNPDGFIHLVDEVVEKLQTTKIDPQVFEALKRKNIGTMIRSQDSFETLCFDWMRCLQEGYTYQESMETIARLTQEDVQAIGTNLNFEHKAIVQIVPKRDKQ